MMLVCVSQRPEEYSAEASLGYMMRIYLKQNEIKGILFFTTMNF